MISDVFVLTCEVLVFLERAVLLEHSVVQPVLGTDALDTVVNPFDVLTIRYVLPSIVSSWIFLQYLPLERRSLRRSAAIHFDSVA